MSLVKRLNQRGDTIVEVLLVVAVIGLVLAGSYAIATRSLKGMRQAQERGEALKLAEGQIESIKTAVAAETPNVIQNGNWLYCLNLPTNPNPIQFTGPPTVPQPLANDDWSRYPTDCVRGLYHIAVQPTEVAGRGNYAVFVRWDGLNGLKQEVILRYRLAEESP